MRRRALIGSSILGLGTPRLASLALATTRGVTEIVTSDQCPYAMAQGPEPDFVLTLSAELFLMLGLQVVYRFLPWPEAEARGQSRTAVAIMPIRRTPPEDDLYIWALTLFDDPSAFGTLGAPAPDTRDAARRLPHIAVIANSTPNGYLREQGFSELLPGGSPAEAAAALHEGRAAAWFSGVPTLRTGLNVIRIGRPIFENPVWLALNRTTDDIMLPTLQDAYAALEADGSIDEMLRPFLGRPA